METNSTGLRAAILAVIFLFFVTARTFAVDCNACLSDLESISAKKQELKKTEALLSQNQRYLASVNAESASKYLKVESNVYQILKKVEALRAEHALLEKKFEKQGCETCFKDDL